MTLAEQQQLIRDAITVLDGRPGKWDGYLRQTLAYALSDHDDPDEGCAAQPGSECLAVATARRVLAGEA